MPPCPSDAPDWMEHAYTAISKVALGPIFTVAVKAWLELEQFQKYKNMGSLPKAKRPQEINKWIAGGRGRRGTYNEGPKFPEHGPAAVFGEKLVAWWASLQPAWRETMGSAGKWPRVEMRLYNELPETWLTLRVPGANGPFIALLGLYWWGREEIKAGGENSKEWEGLAEDIEWVLYGLRSVVGQVVKDEEIEKEKGKGKGNAAAEPSATDQETDQLGSGTD
ncbi:hypothetical protein C8F04DRAFT_966740 [Mycena alexandri]|uniref:Uncharacterized protein n=1 Tax=Mycena alexandri TaxID=1745969 RepID=A0AAD6SE04_9AGAR|nr:hypothetical protein C8F04DRAFT_966740 [Mycena alexandri]